MIILKYLANDRRVIMSYIELKDVVKTYNNGKVKAADGVSFAGEKGEIIVVVGPSRSTEKLLY